MSTSTLSSVCRIDVAIILWRALELLPLCNGGRTIGRCMPLYLDAAAEGTNKLLSALV